MRKIYFAVFFLLVFSDLPATHLVGGELQLLYKTGFNYEVIMNLYFDQKNGNPSAEDQTITVYFFRKRDNKLIDSLLLPKFSQQNIAYSNPMCSNPNLITRQIKYLKEKVFPESVYSDERGYYVIWERCCRNNVINNIVNPGNEGMTYYLEFPPVSLNGARLINSTPAFNLPKGDYLCAGQPFNFNFGATDTDGDELRYSLVTPLAGNSSPFYVTPPPIAAPYSLVTWATGFAADKAIPGSIDADNLKINTQTGLLTGIPDKTKINVLYVFSVLCQEFRNGIKIGEVRRDYQLYVVDCPKNDPPEIKLQTGELNGQAVFYESGQTIQLQSPDNLCLNIWIKDPQSYERVSISFRAINFQPRQSVLSASQGIVPGPNDSLNIQLCWPLCFFTETGMQAFEFELIVKDGGCPASKEDTLRVKLYSPPIANNPPLVYTELADNFVEVISNQNLSFTVFGSDKDNEPVTLKALGREFDLADLGMDFPQVTAIANVQSLFEWNPDCKLITKSGEQKQFLIDFISTDKSLCSEKSDTVTIEILLRDEEINFDSFLPPNAFSPNKDGINELFSLPDLPGENCNFQFKKIEIYNRWGNKVFESRSRDFQWDGADYPQGTYYYRIDYLEKEFKGTITMMR